MAKDWKAQLIQSQEENLKLRLEVRQLKERTAEAVEQARRDEAMKIAKDILEMAGK